MENKDTNTGYRKVVSLRNQKWEIIEITIVIIFFCEMRVHYFLCGELSSPTWKKPLPPKAPIPTQIPNLAQFPPIYEKWLSPPDHLGGEGYELWKPEKGKGIVVVNKKNYYDSLDQLFNDPTKFDFVNEDPTLHNLSTIQRCLNTLQLRGKMIKDKNKQMRPRFMPWK